LDQQENFRYLERLIQEVGQAGSELQKETQRLETMRAELVERSRGRRTVERIRERRFSEWRNDFEKEDRAGLDEIGGVAIHRRREKGSALFTSLLVLLAIGAGVFCFEVWRNWLTS
jgi:flagellar export protein FliJ